MNLRGRAVAAVRAWRRRRFLWRLAVTCRLASAHIDVRVAPDAELGRGIRVRVATGAGGVLHVGAHSSLGDGVEIRMEGGELCIGDWVQVRRGASFMVGGMIDIDGPNLLSWGTTIHCNERVHLAHQSTFGEYVTITDSVHHHRPGAWHLDEITTAPVRVGVDTWVGAKATIARGVTVGDRCIVAAGAVVTGDVPDDHVALGVPARCRPR